jgi:2-oxoglutarate ferredoxin oxidoreductase subunit alpha
VVVCSYGISARVALLAIKMARKKGIKVGMLRLITVWPFPDRRIKEIARNIKAFVVPELNYGQIALEVERCAGGAAETILVPHMGGTIHNPQTILDAIGKAAK